MTDPLSDVRTYHRATKHHTDAYAPGPGFLDWDSQPNPFRGFAGAPRVALPLISGKDRRSYDSLFSASSDGSGRPAALSPESLGLFLELGLGLSAWKVFQGDRWALRNNPSSGNLHPTEGYLVLWRPAGEIVPGVYHYQVHDHTLECRHELTAAQAEKLAAAWPEAWGLVGLASIHWREEWKYGARAWRYCQLDVGHALAALRLSAAVNGWHLSWQAGLADADIAAVLGLDRAGDFAGAEAEHPDLLAAFGPGSQMLADAAAALREAAEGGWQGQANTLSPERVAWPEVALAAAATVKGPGGPADFNTPPMSSSRSGRELDAAQVIRRRRSAQRMDGKTGMARADFLHLLTRLMPRACPPWDALSCPPAVNLVFFVHRVDGLEPGLYALSRASGRHEAFMGACNGKGFAWALAADELPFYRLAAPADLSRQASGIACHQGIAGHGAFSVAMIADLEATLAAEGAWAYRRLYWEAGMIGQMLYLEAEAAGLRGTGIGCFFDDAMHDLIGLPADGDWQDIYHFTVGGALEDSRLSTEPAYGHLGGLAG